MSDSALGQLLSGLAMMAVGFGTLAVGLVGGGFALLYMLQLLAATAGAGPMPPFGEAVTALASVFVFLLALAVVTAMESSDGPSRTRQSSGSGRSSTSRTHRIDRDEASDTLDEIEESLDE